MLKYINIGMMAVEVFWINNIDAIKNPAQGTLPG